MSKATPELEEFFRLQMALSRAEDCLKRCGDGLTLEAWNEGDLTYPYDQARRAIEEIAKLKHGFTRRDRSIMPRELGITPQ